MMMREKRVSKETCRTHRWRDLCDGSKQEPQGTLTDREHVNGGKKSLSRGMVAIPPVSKGEVPCLFCRYRPCTSGTIRRVPW